jgi:hypothetical protein
MIPNLEHVDGGGIMTTLIRTDKGLEELMVPMAPDHFEIAVSHMRLKDQNLIDACKAVLVDEKKNQETEVKYDVKQNHLSTTCGNIVKKWDEICSEQGLECRSIALPPQIMKLVIGFEEHVITPLKKLRK